MPHEDHMPRQMGGDGGRADFNSLIASTIHDMKNSLSIVLNSLDDCMQSPELGGNPHFAQLQCETKRLNGKLIQLLSFYKMDKAMLSVNTAEWCVYGLLTELLLQEVPLLDARNIEGEICCDEDLAWVFDRELVAGALGNALNNAVRYARHSLIVEAQREGNELVISVQDDGAGFPAHILDNSGIQGQDISFFNGNTGLGLYFSRTIAQMHCSNGRAGRIHLENVAGQGGACFSLILP